MRAWTPCLLLAALALGASRAGAECPASPTTERIRVALTPPEGIEIAGVVVTVTYPADKLVIEGRGQEAGHAAVSTRAAGAVTVSEDREGELRLVMAQAKAFPPGPLFDVTFHRCEGARTPVPGELSCRVIDASDTKSTKVSDVRCSVGAAS